MTAYTFFSLAPLTIFNMIRTFLTAKINSYSECVLTIPMRDIMDESLL